jgi:phosphonopyruvate decarboxylase
LIDAADFVESARRNGFSQYTGVPCSFLTPFINYVIQDRDLIYIPSANEGDAVATAAGLTIGGRKSIVMFQNSGLGNAINPLTSLIHTFKIPLLMLVTHLRQPGLKDEPQHEMMGAITGSILDTLDIQWEPFPDKASEVDTVLQRASQYMHEKNLPYALLMKKGSVKPYELSHEKDFRPLKRSRINEKSYHGQGREQRSKILNRIVKLTETNSSVIVATTGYTGRELAAISDRSNHLYMVGSMGCASSLGLGLSLALPEHKVIVIDGDGAAIMRMGNFTTIGACGRENLIHIVLDNGVHESTGGQATVSSAINFAKLAASCGYALVYEGNTPAVLEDLLANDEVDGPRFAHIRIEAGSMDKLPRPELAPPIVLRRLMEHLGTSF